jgi:hypothetical protein
MLPRLRIGCAPLCAPYGGTRIPSGREVNREKALDLKESMGAGRSRGRCELLWPGMQRRTFLASALALPAMRASRAAAKLDLAAIERPRVLKAANKHLGEAPVTVTGGQSAERGGHARFLQRRRLLVARPGEIRGTLHAARRHD